MDVGYHVQLPKNALATGSPAENAIRTGTPPDVETYWDLELQFRVHWELRI